MTPPSETIYNGANYVIPMAEVSHIERDGRPGYAGAVTVIYKHSTWCYDPPQWEPNTYMPAEDAEGFMRAWCFYRAEVDMIQEPA